MASCKLTLRTCSRGVFAGQLAGLNVKVRSVVGSTSFIPTNSTNPI